MRIGLPLVALLLSTACATVSPLPPAIAETPDPLILITSEPIMTYPATRRMDLVEEQFGVPVADPYRWLENDVRNDPEVRSWVDAENVATDKFLATLPLRAAFKARMTELYDYERFGVPEKKGGR